jgi:curved DNA-binding protein CbpA
MIDVLDAIVDFGEKMAIPDAGDLDDSAATRRFLMRLVGERFSGFIDFDSQGKKRRLFFEEGRVFNAQSAVNGENLCDTLLQKKRLDPEHHKNALRVARERKLPLEQALIELRLMTEPMALRALESLCELVIAHLVADGRTGFKATLKAGLRGRMLGNLVELVPLLSEDNKESLRDPNVKEREDPAAGAKEEIRRAYEKMKGATLYELLDSKDKDTVDEIRKHYFDLAKRWHADKYPGLDLGDEKDMLDEIFGAIGEAFATLSDPAKRGEYDAVMERKRKGLPVDMNEIMKAEDTFKKGDALLNRGEFELALKELEEAKRLNPGEAEFWTAYALALYLAKHDAKAAIAAAQKAIEIQPTLARTYETLGRIFNGEGDFRRAKQHFDKCLELNPRAIGAQRELRLMKMRSDKQTPVKREDGASGLLSKLFKR